jgi:hypothetical protein
MDLIYLALAGAFWLAVLGLAKGCAALSRTRQQT